MIDPLKYHWFPDVALDVNTPPLFVIVGVAGVVVTIIVTAFEVAVGVVTHAAFDVIIHVTIAPFVKTVDVNVELFTPTLFPFTCHW
jgi:hypothetical protein